MGHCYDKIGNKCKCITFNTVHVLVNYMDSSESKIISFFGQYLCQHACMLLEKIQSPKDVRRQLIAKESNYYLATLLKVVICGKQSSIQDQISFDFQVSCWI